jgi:hypothetical protein
MPPADAAPTGRLRLGRSLALPDAGLIENRPFEILDSSN